MSPPCHSGTACAQRHLRSQPSTPKSAGKASPVSASAHSETPHIFTWQEKNLPLQHGSAKPGTMKKSGMTDCRSSLLYFHSTLFLFLLFPAADGHPVLVFLSGSHATADMTFRLINVQYNSCPGCQRRIYVFQTIRDILVYSCH